MTLKIRRARPEDREAVLAFGERTWWFGDYITASKSSHAGLKRRPWF